jgi:hypothetical protein
MTATALAALQAKLQDPHGFASYHQMRVWLASEEAMAKPRKPSSKKKRRIISYGHYRGHPAIAYLETGRRPYECYTSDGREVPCQGNSNGVEKPCAFCGLVAEPPPPESELPIGPDACLGMLPHVPLTCSFGVVLNACCGHGHMESSERPYVQIEFCWPRSPRRPLCLADDSSPLASRPRAGLQSASYLAILSHLFSR